MTKTILMVLAVVTIALYSCGSGKTDKTTTTDSTLVAKDTTKIILDTCAKVDTTKVKK